MTSTQNIEKIEVKVGPYDESGTFLGEIVRFSGEEVGTYVEYLGGDTRGTNYTLFRTPDGMYRMLVEHWSRWQGEGSLTRLLPTNHSRNPYSDPPDEYFDAEYYGPLKYDKYPEEEARSIYPEIFAALGMPNVKDLD